MCATRDGPLSPVIQSDLRLAEDGARVGLRVGVLRIPLRGGLRGLRGRVVRGLRARGEPKKNNFRTCFNFKLIFKS